LDGTKYEGGGLIVPVASTNTTVEEVTPEMIADFVEANSSKIGDKNTVKVGIYKFPNSNKVSIDLNVVAPESSREQAIEFGKMADQESLFDLSTFENVKTGGTGSNPTTFTDAQFKEIAKALNEGRVPDVFTQQAVTPNEVTLENFAELEAQAAQNNDSERIKTLRAARMVTKALKGVKVFIHNSPEEYQQALANASGDSIDTIKAEETEGRSAGQYVNGEIHIDGTIGSARTVYHEAFHDAILKSGLAVDMARGLSKIISDKKLRAQINEFISRYENAEQNEEMIAELGAIMAEAEVELTTTKLQQFKQLINKLAQKLGLPAILPAAADRQQVVDFINSMSKNLRTGKAVTEGVTTTIKPVGRKSRKVSFKGNYDLSFVQESDIIDFNALVNDIVAKDQKVWFWVADQLGRGYYFDEMLNGQHYLDAGPSYALDPENRSKGIIWASGMAKKSIEKNISNSDYIFIISGSPDKSKLFNKSVTGLVKNRIEKNVTFKKFKSSLLKANPPKGLRDILEAYNSFEDLLMGPDRKNFMNEVNVQRSKKGTEARALLEKYGAFINEQDLRDGFFADNGFEQGDVMLVLKAN
jgi:hypothetical protein